MNRRDCAAGQNPRVLRNRVRHRRKFARGLATSSKSPNQVVDPADEALLRRALALALKGEGRVEPNPMVGCVISRGGRVIAEGYHRRFGGPHAEIEALRQCPGSPRGATLHVTLEPCSILGKTPPCVDALIAAGVSRVVIGVRDPNPRVDGRGVAALRAAGIDVVEGLLAEEAAELIAPFTTRMRLHRPYVIAKWAQSLDGKLATTHGDSKWISGEASRRMVHRLRARVDAVVVGSGTVLRDDPLLTARDVTLRRTALRVVLDRRLRLKEKCQLVDTSGDAPVVVFTTMKAARSAKAQRLHKHGVEVVGLRGASDAAFVKAVLKGLHDRDATNVLVEGGPGVLTTFFAAGSVDEAWVFTAPRLMGGERAPSAILGPGALREDRAIAPRVMEVRRVGEDVFHRVRMTDIPTGKSGK